MEKQYDSDGLELLRSAIVLQAVSDYEDSVAILSTEYSPSTLKREQRIAKNKWNSLKMKSDCERFFKSVWYKALTTIDSQLIIKTISDGIQSADRLVRNDKGTRYICTCKSKLNVNRYNMTNELGSPVLKCKVCGKYYRVFGKYINVE